MSQKCLAHGFGAPNSSAQSPSHRETNTGRTRCREPVGCDQGSSLVFVQLSSFLSYTTLIVVAAAAVLECLRFLLKLLQALLDTEKVSFGSGS